MYFNEMGKYVLMHFQFLCELTAMSALAYGSLVWPPSKFHRLHPGVGTCSGCYIGVCVWKWSEATSMPTTSGQLVPLGHVFCVVVIILR